MKRNVKRAVFSIATLVASGAAASSAAVAQGQNLALQSCIYHCGAGPDGNGGVPAAQYQQCVAFCHDIYDRPSN